MTTAREPDEASREEIAALRQRVAELTQAESIARANEEQRRRTEEALLVSETRFRALTTLAPVGIFQTDKAGDCLFVNERWCAITGLTPDEAMGPGWSRTLHPEDQERVYNEWYAAAEANREFILEYRFKTRSGKVTWVSGSTVTLHDAGGEVVGYLGTITDISANKQVEEMLRENLRQQEIISAQRLTLDELSTPLIPISDQIMVMPLVGLLDSMRAQQVLQMLLTGIARSRAHVAILDITGVSTVDTQVANALLRAAHAVRLLGAQMVLTGIRPEVAQTLIALGADLRGVVTCGTLQAGIAYAMETRPKGSRS